MSRLCIPVTLALILQFSFVSSPVEAQDEIGWLKAQTAILAGPEMGGRGYVDSGGMKAASYINSQFKSFGLLPFPGSEVQDKAHAYFQLHHFPVNTFPGVVSLRLNRKVLVPGKDFLVHGASVGIMVSNKKVKTIDLAQIADTLAWDSLRQGFSANGAYLLKNIDRVMEMKKLSIRSLAKQFTAGIFLVPMAKKLTWLVTTDTIGATLIFVEDSVMPKEVRKMSAIIENQFLPAFPTQNVLGYVRGTEKPDSFIVFTAHYDHLGKMGEKAVFTGANDNASGTAMLLSMAKYYALHPQKYSVAFMAFSGEEAGLIGSTFYVNHPVFPLEQISFVLNMDMMGDATKGITVVNAPANPAKFALMEQINKDNKYLPAVVSRGQTRNSDHYPFSQKGVSAVFIYTNGVKPYYHDIKDRPEEVNFEYGLGVVQFLEELVGKLQS